MARNSDKQKDLDNATALTGHTTAEGVVEDPQNGKVQSRHETTVVTDPESDLAVQVPSPEENPLANATETDPLRRDATPNDVFNGDAEPDLEAVAEDEANDEPEVELPPVNDDD